MDWVILMGGNVLILASVSEFIDKFEMNNASILQSKGYKVYYAANMNEHTYGHNQEEIDKLGVTCFHVEIARSPFMVRQNYKALKQLERIIRENNINLIHCHTPVGGVLGRMCVLCCNEINIKVIYTAHGFHFYKGAPLINNTCYRIVESVFARLTDTIVVINQEDYNSANQLRLRRDGRAYKIPGIGLDLQRFKPLPRQKITENRQKLGITENDFLIISVGELNQNKNQIMVLRALEKMKQEGHRISDVKYVICGRGFYEEQFPQWINEKDLADRVSMLGYRKDIENVIGCADATIFPSKREGLGMAALESLAMGIPVIASDNRGTREYMSHKENGFVCNCESVDEFIEGIEFVYDLPNDKREVMMKKCVDSVYPFRKSQTDSIMDRVYTNVFREKEGNTAYEYERNKGERCNGSVQS
ncbi:MAG: glycosyltransferase family 4 protein [Suipraeoptans sp.]